MQVGITGMGLIFLIPLAHSEFSFLLMKQIQETTPTRAAEPITEGN